MTDSIRLVNTETKKELVIATRTTPFVLENVDWGVVESKHQSYKYIDQIGVYITGTTLETRDISLVGWVIGRTLEEINSRKAILNTMINPKHPIDVHTGKYKIRMHPTSSIRYSASYKENNEAMCKFMINGLCPDPLFSSEFESRVEGASTIPKFHFPLVFPKKGIIMSLRQPSLIIAVNNKGVVPVGMRIEFKANGTVENPRLINANTQEFFAVNKVLVAGETVTINTNDGSKKVTGELSNKTLNYYQYRDLQSKWLKLEVGTNLFRYDADKNIDALEVVINSDNKFLEVQ